MRYYSIFSGIEAASIAWGPLGWEALLFSEIEEFPSAVLKTRFPHVPNLGDITKINWKEAVRDFGKPDVVVGGSPCQSFSIAGNRTGLDGASGLMWEYVRCVREVRPRWFVWENVPGALSSAHGEDFGCLLRSMDELGYGLAWSVLDAQFAGVPQRRRRVFLVGSLGDRRSAEVLFEPDSLRWDSPSSREKRKELAAGAGGGAEAAGFRWHQGSGAGAIGYEPDQSPTLDTVNPPAICMAGQQPNSMVSDEVCGTLTAHEAKGGGNRMRKAIGFAANQRGKQVHGVTGGYAVRRLTPRECERIMGMPDDWTKVPYRGKPADECPDTPRYKAIGNSMAVNVMRWLGVRIQEVVDE